MAPRVAAYEGCKDLILSNLFHNFPTVGQIRDVNFILYDLNFVNHLSSASKRHFQTFLKESEVRGGSSTISAPHADTPHLLHLLHLCSAHKFLAESSDASKPDSRQRRNQAQLLCN